MTYYSEEQVQKLLKDFSKVDGAYKNLLLEYSQISFTNKEAYEYANHGFMRRVKTLYRCIYNVYDLCPPDKLNKPSKEVLADININLQSFIFNLYGCVDNLAWIFVKEKNIKCHKMNVNLFNKKVSKGLSQGFKEYLEKFKKWYQYVENFRHSLAHRIPLYVPPFSISNDDAKKYNSLEQQIFQKILEQDFEGCERLKCEQKELGTFVPQMTHSFSESSGIVPFHVQILDDWSTIVELSDKFLEELKVSV